MHFVSARIFQWLSWFSSMLGVSCRHLQRSVRTDKVHPMHWRNVRLVVRIFELQQVRVNTLHLHRGINIMYSMPQQYEDDQ
mmetsp:Transcript_16171/g.54161  ORF Transcript_16171/g.54161 Transcript_16171/m.54161 type:complete len:81 (+) Transcript_16171:5237-5479(+)